jgi:hypothetical protein
MRFPVTWWNRITTGRMTAHRWPEFSVDSYAACAMHKLCNAPFTVRSLLICDSYTNSFRLVN